MEPIGDEGGFTLVELIVTLVVIGVLTTVAIVGVNGLTGKSATSACELSMNAANATSAAYFTRSNTYPQTFADLTHPPASQALLDASGGLIESPTTLKGNGGWTLILQPGPTPTDRTTFSGC